MAPFAQRRSSRPSTRWTSPPRTSGGGTAWWSPGPAPGAAVGGRRPTRHRLQAPLTTTVRPTITHTSEDGMHDQDTAGEHALAVTVGLLLLIGTARCSSPAGRALPPRSSSSPRPSSALHPALPLPRPGPAPSRTPPAALRNTRSALCPWRRRAPDCPARATTALSLHSAGCGLPSRLAARYLRAHDDARGKLEQLTGDDERRHQRTVWFAAAAQAQAAVTRYAQAKRLNRFEVEQRVRLAARNAVGPGH